MVRDSDDDLMEDARSAASILQSKQLISTNVITKRKEQLSRWENSQMNGEAAHRTKKARVHFQDSDIFLSACMSGDEEEVEELLRKGAQINTATVDGLTALHQSVIDSKPEMVAFLCKNGADVNAQDNEGWTPLHAAACCANVSIVKLLCEMGASLDTINSDKELPIDLAEDEECKAYLESMYTSRGIDMQSAREAELSLMLRDVHEWIRKGKIVDGGHARTGATALHVAAAKGYTQVVELLVKAGADVNAVDAEGWTPLHAAAHWGEKDTCKMIMNAGASLQTLNYAGQNVLGVADKDIVEFLEFEKVEEEAVVVSREKKSPCIHSPSPLGEKNLKVHSNHLSTEEKHSISLADERSENETLHSASKVPRLSEERQEIRSEEERESSISSSSSSSVTPTDKSTTPSISISNVTVKAMPSHQDSTSTSGAESTIQFTVPLRSWTRPVPLTSSSRSTSSSATSITSTTASTSSPSLSSPLSVKPPPWQSATVASQESEAERRQTARIQRQHRRSTQGVTKEQLEEATRMAAEEASRRRMSLVSGSSATSSGPCRLASEEKDSSVERSLSTHPTSTITAEVRICDRESSERLSDSSGLSHSSPPSCTLSLSTVPPPSATPSATNIRRKSQVLSGTSRSNRRSTGPVLAEDVAAAVEKGNVPSWSTVSRPTEKTITATVTPMPPSSTVNSRPPMTPSSTVTTGRIAPRVVASTNQSGTSNQTERVNQFAAPTISSAAAATANYKMLYEKERVENEKLRRELEETKRSGGHENGSSTVRRMTSMSTRLSNASSSGLSKSPSANSIEDPERRVLEKRISELELELKTLSQLRLENQRLKEENGALVRVISKMTI